MACAAAHAEPGHCCGADSVYGPSQWAAAAGQRSILGSSLFRSKSRLADAPPPPAQLSQTSPSHRKRQAWQGAEAELSYNSEIVRVSGPVQHQRSCSVLRCLLSAQVLRVPVYACAAATCGLQQAGACFSALSGEPIGSPALRHTPTGT